MELNYLQLIKVLSKYTLYGILIQTCFLTFLLAGNGSAQTKSVREVYINVSDSYNTVEEVFKSIENQTEFEFAYSKMNLSKSKNIKLTSGKRPVDLVLLEISKEFGLKFKQVNKSISASKIQKDDQNDNFNRVEVLADVTVSGKVTDENGEGLPGASVIEKGTINGTTTDLDGNYKLDLSDDGILVISFVGYKTTEIIVAGRSTIDIQMELDAEKLKEVVVIGYGTVKKSDLTGAISSVKSEDLPLNANTSIGQALAAKAPGLVITQGSNQPGGATNVLIRGRASVGAGNTPLYVIDGFPIGSGSIEPGGGNSKYGNSGSRDPLNSINPNDIESIEILKDASSTAIYGARAANGVILITTKRGKAGAPTVTYNGNYTIQKTAKWWDLLNAQEYMIERNELLVENGQAEAYTATDISQVGQGTDWFEAVTRPAYLTQHNVSIKGGNDYTKYLFSANYFDQQGLLKNSDLTRYTVRLNLDQKISERISWGMTLTGSQIDNVNAPLGDAWNENAPPLRGVFLFSPITPVFDSNGDYSLHEIGPAIIPNPVSLFEVSDNTRTNRTFVQGFVDLKIMKGLTGRLKVGMDRRSGKRDEFLPRTLIHGAPLRGQGSKSFQENSDYLFEGVLTYEKNISEIHNLGAVVGYSYQEFNWEGFRATNNDFISDGLLYNDLGAGNGTKIMGSYKGVTELASYFGRLNYSYDDKYLVTASIRADGSPRFGANNKFGYFPSVAFGWRIINEDFFPQQGVVSNLKLRVSYGQTGNADIGGGAQAEFRANSNYLFGSRGSEQRLTGVTQTQLANPDLKWETTTEVNFGLDFGFFEGGITGTVEYFSKEVSDLLSSRQLKSFLPITMIADNIGITSSKGVEISLRTVNQFGELKWSMDMNFATYRDRWKERHPDTILPPYLKEKDLIRPEYAYQIQGVFQDGETAPVYQPDIRPGEILLVDWNGLDSDGNLTGEPDGSITSADQVFIGTEDPGFTYGMGTRFEYKGFDLYAFFQGMGDRIKNNSVRDFYTTQLGLLRDSGRNMLVDVLDRWTPENPDGLGRRYEGVPESTKSLFYEEAAFLRLRNLTFGYNFPESLLGEKLFKSARLYFDAQNVFVLTNYTGIDPETDGIGAYPNQRSFTIGVNLTF